MLNHTLAVLALRAHLATLSIASTGATNLVATTTGYTRPAGSFITDGFAKGMEITPTAFASNPVDTLTSVAALELKTTNARSAEALAGGRTIAAKLPVIQAWENIEATPLTARWYLEEEYLPGPSNLLGTSRFLECFPTYIVKLYGLSNTGITALYRGADAVLALFPPRQAFTLSTGDVLRVRTNPAPSRGQLIPLAAGRAAIVVTVPLRAETANSI